MLALTLLAAPLLGWNSPREVEVALGTRELALVPTSRDAQAGQKAKKNNKKNDKQTKRTKPKTNSAKSGNGLAPQEPVSPAIPELDRDLPPQVAARALNEALCSLVSSQHADGSWGSPVPDDLVDSYFPIASYPAWNQAAHALGLMALMDSGPSEAHDASLEAGVDWLCRTELTHRADNWDVDSTWASLYGFVGLVQAAGDARFAGAASQRQIHSRGMEFYDDLLRRQTPDGGWAYYDDRPWTSTPKWATSFCTALVLPALIDARQLGWAIDPEVIRRATELIQRCARPNGAYSYSFEAIPRAHGGTSINQIPGSLGRIQVCNWALARAGDPRITPDVLREGLEHFFEHHAYLDMVRTRPVPHEGWFANAGYFYYFGHFYAAKVIGLLPEEERELWHRRMRYHITKTLTPQGTCSDFMASSYMIQAGTSFAAATLAAGLSAEELAAGSEPLVQPITINSADEGASE